MGEGKVMFLLVGFVPLRVGLDFGQNCMQVAQKGTHKRFTLRFFIKQERHINYIQCLLKCTVNLRRPDIK